MDSKKLCTGLFLLTAVNSAYAGLTTDAYVGAGIGGAFVNSETSLSAGPLDLKDFGISALNDSSLGDNGFAGTMFAGIDFALSQCDAFVLGLEAKADFNNAEANSNLLVGLDPIISEVTAISTRVNVKNAYSLSLLPGYHPTEDLLIYGRAGAVMGEIEVNTVGAVSYASDTFHKLGGQVGAGTEYKLADNLSLRGEYTYSFYPTIYQDVSASVNIPPSPPSTPGQSLSLPLEQSYRVNTSAINLGLKYTF